MKITLKLKQHMTEKFAVAADATDEVIKKAVAERITSGELELETVKSLTAAEPTGAEQKVQSLVNDAVTKAMGPVLDQLKAMTGAKGGDGAALETKATLVAPATPAAPPSDAAKAFNAAAALSGSTDTQVRVKSVVEQFNDTRTAATYCKSSNPYLAKAFAGQQVQAGSGSCYTLDMPTDRQKAIAGAWFKNMAVKAMRGAGRTIPSEFQLKEIDRQLLQYAVHECKFVGPIGWQGNEDRDSSAADHWYEGEKLASDLHRKAILDDSTSGGLEAVPIEFDAAVILTPLLNNELFPLVNLINVTRRRIEATKIGNPTMSWGTAEGTEISLFDTDAFISAFDNSIWPITGACELGLDFLADSPLSVGGIVVNNYGQRFGQSMDNVIATGNGTNQPEGIFTASGLTTVTPAGGAGTAPQVGDYEGLMFAVGKEYLQEAGMPPNSRAVFLGTQTSYSRIRGIPVDSSNDARRIFGQDNQMDYRLMQFRFAINGSLTNAQQAFVCLNRYRMYRRQGLEVRFVTQDWGLARANKQGLIVRARFGGALELAGAAAKITAAQA